MQCLRSQAVAWECQCCFTYNENKIMVCCNCGYDILLGISNHIIQCSNCEHNNLDFWQICCYCSQGLSVKWACPCCNTLNDILYDYCTSDKCKVCFIHLFCLFNMLFIFIKYSLFHVMVMVSLNQSWLLAIMNDNLYRETSNGNVTLVAISMVYLAKVVLDVIFNRVLIIGRVNIVIYLFLYFQRVYVVLAF